MPTRSIRPPRPSVREHVKDDNRQDARGRQCRRGDEERRQGIADQGERLPHGLRQYNVTVPVASRAAQPVTSTATGRASSNSHRVHIRTGAPQTIC